MEQRPRYKNRNFETAKDNIGDPLAAIGTKNVQNQLL